jgi:TonB family protein
MTSATSGSSRPNIFSMFSGGGSGPYRGRETFVFSLIGQAVIVGLLVYFTRCVITGTPQVIAKFPDLKELPLIFSGHNGGGGGNHDQLPASLGDLPQASLQDQIVPPTVIVAQEPPKLSAPESVTVAPEVKLPQGGPIGDPMSRFSLATSDGPGGPGGIGPGCCNGVGPSTGTGAGPGPPGIYPAGKQGVTVPQPIYSPEPGFSDEARRTKEQGTVVLLVVVGPDGHTYNIRIGQSRGMGLDEKAVEAVSRWRFKPATLNGQPVATQIAVEVNFHLY